MTHTKTTQSEGGVSTDSSQSPCSADSKELEKRVILDVLEEHGIKKGSRIIGEVGKITEVMVKWPEDIREECLTHMKTMLKVAEDISGRSNC